MKNVLTPARGAILATIVVGFTAPAVAQGLDRAIATGEQAIYANLMLTIGVVMPEGG